MRNGRSSELKANIIEFGTLGDITDTYDRTRLQFQKCKKNEVNIRLLNPK